MRTLTTREIRTIRIAGIGIAIYLALFFVWKPLQKQRAAYTQLARNARDLQLRVAPYETRALTAKKLMEEFQLDPAKLSKATVVGEASAAIQKAAASSGVRVGPVRESPSRASGKELASVQFEGTGQVASVMGLLKRMETLGYPMVLDSVQITPDTHGPGQVKMNVTVVILDFDQWKTEEKPNA
ncbi:MAG TPA: hypothetical protein VFM25_00345 [Verrucomicrobiae bacterium]|nr:hypothetical protein [Verrucomicrobiae bacterium]